jgi:hypothetical protein
VPIKNLCAFGVDLLVRVLEIDSDEDSGENILDVDSLNDSSAVVDAVLNVAPLWDLVIVLGSSVAPPSMSRCCSAVGLAVQIYSGFRRAPLKRGRESAPQPGF